MEAFVDETTQWHFYRHLKSKLDEAAENVDFPQSYKHALNCLLQLETTAYTSVKCQLLLAEAEACLSKAVKQISDPSDLLQCYHLWMCVAYTLHRNDGAVINGIEAAFQVFGDCLNSSAIEHVKTAMKGYLAYREDKEVVVEWCLLIRTLEDLKFCYLFQSCKSVKDLGYLFNKAFGRTLNEALPQALEYTKQFDAQLLSVKNATGSKVLEFMNLLFGEEIGKYTAFWFLSDLIESVGVSNTGTQPMTPSEEADMADGVLDGVSRDTTPLPSLAEACRVIQSRRAKAPRVGCDNHKIRRERLPVGLFAAPLPVDASLSSTPMKVRGIL